MIYVFNQHTTALWKHTQLELREPTTRFAVAIEFGLACFKRIHCYYAKRVVHSLGFPLCALAFLDRVVAVPEDGPQFA
ncbi:MAG: hypothetical protein QNJ09_18190 [Paracoccaceae bacterium]|nr:hypothetical protein [Paracoccaceae bacterium]